MKKKELFLSLVLAILVAIPILFSGCGVTPMAHVRFKSDEGVIYYTNGHFYEQGPSIYYYETQEDLDDDWAYNWALSIQFLDETFGKETINGVDCEDCSLNTKEIHVTINKSKSTFFSTSKDIYLNGEKLTPYSTQDESTLYFYTFRNVDFVRANTTGQDSGFMNIIEYK